MRPFSRYLTGFLASSLAVVGLQAAAGTPAPAAEPEPPAAVTDSYERPDEVSAQLAARLTGHRVEITGQRSETSLTWANPDGTFTSEIASGPVRVRKNGEWVPLDLTLERKGGRIRPVAAATDISFSDGGNGPLTTQKHEGKTLSLGWKGSLPKPVLVGGTAIYQNAIPGADLEVAATSFGFTEKLVVRSRPATAPVLRFPITANGVKVSKAKSGDLEVKDAKGKLVAHAVAPKMWDASINPLSGDPARTQQMPTEVVAGQGGDELVVSPPASFFDDPNVKYPVTVDPSVSLANLGDTWVETGTTSAQIADPWLKVGTYDGGAHVARSLIKWSTGSLNGKHVLSASMSLFEHWSYSCTASQMNLGPVNAAFGSTTVWTNQPTYTGTYGSNATFAKGYSSSCPDGRQSISILPMVDAWADGALTNNGLKMWGGNESDSYTWKKFCSANVSGSSGDAPCTSSANLPTITVTYNSYPATPTTLSPANASYTNDTTPTYTAKVTDPDGGSVHGVYYIEDVSGPVWVANGGVGSTVSSGGTTSYTRTSQLTNGHTYRWRVKGHDGTDWGPLAPSPTTYYTFTVDTTAPASPVVASTAFPANVWTPKTSGTFTWTESSTDVTGYYYGLDTPTPATWTTATVSATLSPADGWHTFYVRSKDRAGNLSPVTAYSFGMGGGLVMSPADQDRTSAAVTLTSDTPTKNEVTYKYHAGTNPATAFVTVPTADVTPPGSSTPISSWPHTRSVSTAPFSDLVWNVAKTLSDAGKVDGPVQVEACFTTGGGSESCSTPVTFTVNRAAFGNSYAVGGMGPGRLSLLTGDYAVNEADVSVADLSVSRTHNTLKPATATGVFGPGWTTSIPGAAAGAAEYALEEHATESYVLLLGADGETLTYLKGTGSTYTGIGDANDGSVLVKDTSTQFTLTDPDGGTTVWTLVNSTWVATKVTAPIGSPTSAESTTSFDHDSLGRLTRILGAVPDGVTCTTTLNTGCRALDITYASSTTATGTTEAAWGDYTGNISQISFTGYDPAASAMSTTVVERYLYDSTGHLRAAWDPRISPALKTRYSYDGAGRLSTMTPPGLADWSLSYDTKGRLAHVSRVDPVNGTATKAVAYDVPLDGTGAPFDMSLSQTQTWGQNTDLPRGGAAVFPASHVPTRAGDGTYTPGSTDWPYAKLTYLDVNGRPVNSASYGAGAWQVSTTRYDTGGNAVWQLSAGNRAAALSPTADTDPYVAGLSDSAVRADLLATETIYSADGLEVVSSQGPAHRVTLDSGAVASARMQTTYTYDQGKPDSTVYHLVTTTSVAPNVLDGTATTAGDTRVTTTGYAALVTGDTTGWTLRRATSESTTMAAGQPAVVKRTRLDSTGRVIESRLPSSDGTDAGTTVTTYYTSAANATFPACGGKPEWAGQQCRTGPKAQPAGTPLPVTTTAYDVWLNGSTVTETMGTTTRVNATTYDAAGRVTGRTVTVTPTADGGDAVPAVSNTFDSATGLELTLAAGGATLTNTYDSLGRQTSYTDADGNTTTTSYDIDGRVHTVNDGKGTYTYTYDGTDASGLTERRGKLTSLDTGMGSSPSVFGAAYDNDGRQIVQGYPNGLVAQTAYDNAGNTVRREYVKDAVTWLTFDSAYSGHGQIREATSSGSSQQYAYDPAGRLTEVRDEAGAPCVTRTYGYDLNSNRTSAKAYPAAADESCSTTTTPVAETHSFDAANRITDSGYGYDALGRTTAVPAGGNAGGSALTSGYHADNKVSTLTQAGRTKTFALDPLQRTRSVSDTAAATITNHYSNGGDSPSWIGEATTWVRNVDDTTGDLGAIQASDGSVVLQLVNLHGDVVAYAEDSTTAVGIDAYFESTEFGAPRSGNVVTPERYGWLGAKQRSADALAGFVLMGIRVYNPATGRFLQTDPIPGGSANQYDYASQDPINSVDLDGRAVAPGGGSAYCGKDSAAVGNFLFGDCWPSNIPYRYWARTPAGFYVVGLNRDHCTTSPDRPNMGTYRFNFISACDMHDYGYELMRRGHLYNSAKGSIDSWFYWVLKNGICSIYGAIKRRICNGLAYTYYQAVKHFGST